MTLTVEAQAEREGLKTHVELGLERLLEEGSRVHGARVGLICNQASVDHGYRHAAGHCERLRP